MEKSWNFKLEFDKFLILMNRCCYMAAFQFPTSCMSKEFMDFCDAFMEKIMEKSCNFDTEFSWQPLGLSCLVILDIFSLSFYLAHHHNLSSV